MLKYIIKRILIAIPVLLGITILDYLIMSLAKAIQLGLDKPFYVQYFVWLKNLLQGNLGYSIKSYQPVSQIISSHLGPTLLLMGSSLLVGLVIAIPIGI